VPPLASRPRGPWSGALRGRRRTRCRRTSSSGSRPAYVKEFDAFARCVRDGTPPRCTGQDALAAFDLAVAADRSWRSGRPISVKPTQVEGGVVYEIEES
jgi:predicted dehydrogenase